MFVLTLLFSFAKVATKPEILVTREKMLVALATISIFSVLLINIWQYRFNELQIDTASRDR